MIRKLPFAERPRERCLQFGPEVLSLRELLAILIGSGPKGLGCLGVAKSVLERMGEEEIALKEIDYKNIPPLTHIKGLGRAGMSRLLAAFEIARRVGDLRSHRKQSRRKSKDRGRLHFLRQQALRKVPKEFRASRREWIGFIPLFIESGMGNLVVVERGVRSTVNFDPKDLFFQIFSLRADAFFLVHAHPSGDSRPSLEDWELTEQVKKIGRSLNTPLVDHLIVSRQSVSWLEEEMSRKSKKLF